MNINRRLLAILLAIVAGAASAAQGQATQAALSTQVPAPTLESPTSPDEEGFIPRWLLLEPIETSGLTESAVQGAVNKEYFPNQFTVIPHDGEKVTISGGVQLTWHAVDTKLYNVNLFHFARALGKPTSNVLFWAVTVVDAPQEMTGVRLAVGSNAASVWWVNGKEVIGIYGDRQTVIDDGVSKRLTLNKGPNVIRAAIVNGGGATDFCARFLDSQDRPLKAFKVRLGGGAAVWPAFRHRAPIEQQLTFTPYHDKGIYDVGETVGWTVTPGPVKPRYAYRWTIRRNNAVVLKEGKLDLSAGKDKIEISGDQPEMIYVAIEPYAPAASAYLGGNTGRNSGLYAVGAAVAPAKIGLSAPRPADFDSFWDGKLAKQSKVPINAVLTPVQSDVPGVDLSMFVLDALGSKAHGYIAKPAREGKFPALIQLQYAGVYALNTHGPVQHAAEGWLSLDVDSHDKLPSDPSGNIPRNYQTIGNSDREKSYFLDMYLRDSRVLDYLLTRPDWDGKTIVLTGGSMGGQQSLVLAGLRPEKITAVLVSVPAGADTNGDLHGRKAGYPNWPADNPDAMKTALYFDTVNFASRIKAPLMAGMGFIDTIAPPAGVWTALNQIPGPKEVLPMIESEHDNLTPQKGRACTTRMAEILDVMVKGDEYRPNE